MKEDSVMATLTIDINVTCPNCDYYIELLSETNLNEDGYLLDMAVPNEPWCDAHRNFECEVICPKCKHEFCIKGLEW